ncbi:MAG: hypothetical protein MdMp014T_2462 [Treponematales bacterium]
MAHTQDYIPTRDADFDGWFLNLKNYVTTKTSGGTPAWTHIPADKVTSLAARYDAWHSAYEATVAPHTSVQTEAKNDQRKSTEAFVRPFVNQYLRFEPVTNEDRTAMGVHNKDTTRTDISTPTSRPVITDLKPLGGFQIEIAFRDEPTPDSRAIPYGCNGCLLNYAVGAAKTEDYAALATTKLMTKSPWTLGLTPDTEGKFLSCATRWQNEKGELGPWSEVQHTVVA